MIGAATNPDTKDAELNRWAFRFTKIWIIPSPARTLAEGHEFDGNKTLMATKLRDGEQNLLDHRGRWRRASSPSTVSPVFLAYKLP